ncbi:glycosyltransferase [Cellulomonas sp. Root137]|uniref:glycosyltransferase n=1 Tax=Cellulomonas sp. Root137 TaxID=1736459 RepID=UPI0006F982EC|nr:glycosyltransferase [Cellulomonas sp. Root137]KQY42914.1 glycosyltransferase [Cellulomonas sp. Root137]
MTSVIIAAYNEAAVIGRNLDRLLAGAAPGELEVIVVANGCVDETVAAASARDVHVLDLPTPGKAAALNAGDAVATSTPRVYLDADIATTPATVRALAAALAQPGPDGAPAPLAAVPDRHLVLTGRPLAVRCYYAIQSRLPAARTGLYGRGMIALSAAGRARFDRFPDVLADDLFLDSLFSAQERVVLDSVTTEVETPRRTGDLVKRLTRVRRGNVALRASAAEQGRTGVRASSRTSWLTDVVLRRPWLAPAGVVYAVLTLVADRRARQGGERWELDTSSRLVG